MSALSSEPAFEERAPAQERPLTFEEALARLEKVVDELEHGELPLERALALFEEGVRLSRTCSELLDRAEARIELLQKTAESAFETRPFTGGDRAS